MMTALECRMVKGHVLAAYEGRTLLLDTGSPESFGDVREVAIGKARHRLKRGYGIVNLEEVSGFVGHQVDAIVGMDILGRYNLQLDMAAGTTRFLEEPPAVQAEAVIPFQRRSGGLIFVDAVVAGRKACLAFDTGAYLSYMLPEFMEECPACGPLADYYPMIGHYRVDTRRVPVSLGTAEMEVRMGEAPEEVQTVLAAVGAQGIIGSALLEAFQVVCTTDGRLLLARHGGKTGAIGALTARGKALPPPKRLLTDG